MSRSAAVLIRTALLEDVPALQRVIEASVRGLQAQDYTEAQIEGALKNVYGVDTRLIADGTYFVAEARPDQANSAPDETKERPGVFEGARFEATVRESRLVEQKPEIVGCGGWSKRKTLFGGDQWSAREDDLLDPACDAAKIRAFFVHPERARRGIGTLILEACENAAKAAGFRRLEMGATLSGVPFYRAKGYVALEDVAVPLGNGEVLPIVRMAKDV